MDKFEYQPATLNAQTVKMDGPRGFVGTAEKVRSRVWAREFGKRNLMSAVRLAREAEVDFVADFETMDALREAADADLYNLTPGTFVAQGEWKQRGYVLSSQPKGIHFGWVNTSLVIALLDGAWWRKRNVTLLPPEEAPTGKTYKSKTGTSVTLTGAVEAQLHWLAVYGKSTQAGTPTADNPQRIYSVGDGKNLFGAATTGAMTGSSATYVTLNNSGGTCFVAKVAKNTDYVITSYYWNGLNRFRVCLFDTDPREHYGEQYAQGHFNSLVITNDPVTDQTTTFNSGSFEWVCLGQTTSAVTFNPNALAQLETGSTATSYEGQAGCAVLDINGGKTVFDLGGNILASLPNGSTRDKLTVGANGVVKVARETALLEIANSDISSFNPPTYHGGYYSLLYLSPSKLRAAGCTSALNAQNCRCSVASVKSSINGKYQIAWGGGTNYVMLSLPPSIDTEAKARSFVNNGEVTVLVPISSQTTTLSATMPTVDDGDVLSIASGVAPSIKAEYEVAQHLNLDYPHDYEFDYARPVAGDMVDTGRLVPCKPFIIFYGPVTDPEVTIAGNRYMVEGTVAAGARIEVDGRAKTVKMIAQDGTVTDKFADALRGSGEGGGEYIFQPIPPGEHAVTWDTTFGVDLGWYEEVGEPPWSQS